MRIANLRAKYEEMLRLRLLHAAGDEPDPRRAMAKLAGEFPGALREIDELPLDDIRARLHALEAAETAEAPVLPWMVATARFHALTRGALCAKSWLAGRRAVTDATREAFAREAMALCWGEDALAWTEELHRVASPPRGRITALVFGRIAAELGTDDAGVRALVFPASRRARTA